ncbi:MAG: toll/interleukin-1 receptor domain-containing protein [bacterium]|nr:MAG: toll/interleukin-1 receptor domain-containing protein [bacterium]
MNPGNCIVDIINAALEYCYSVLLLWSVHAKESSWIRKEWQSAFMKDKEIIPTSIDDTPFPILLKSLKKIDLKDRYYEDIINYLMN